MRRAEECVGEEHRVCFLYPLLCPRITSNCCYSCVIVSTSNRLRLQIQESALQQQAYELAVASAMASAQAALEKEATACNRTVDDLKFQLQQQGLYTEYITVSRPNGSYPSTHPLTACHKD